MADSFEVNYGAIVMVIIVAIVLLMLFSNGV